MPAVLHVHIGPGSKQDGHGLDVMAIRCCEKSRPTSRVTGMDACSLPQQQLEMNNLVSFRRFNQSMVLARVFHFNTRVRNKAATSITVRINMEGRITKVLASPVG